MSTTIQAYLQNAAGPPKADTYTYFMMQRLLVPILLFAMARISFAQEVQRADLTASLGHTQTVTSVGFSANGRYALSGDEGGMTFLWEVASGRMLRSFSTATSKASRDKDLDPDIKVLGFAGNGTQVLTGGAVTTLWDIATGAKVRTFPLPPIPPGLISWHGQETVATQNEDDKRNVEDMLLYVSNGSNFNAPQTMHYSDDFTPDLVSPTGQYVVLIKQVLDSSGNFQFSFNCGTSEFAKSLAFSADGSLLLVTGLRPGATTTDTPERKAQIKGYQPTVCVIDVRNRRMLASFNGHTNSINDGAFSRDNRSVVTASEDHTVRVWDIASAQQVASIPTGKESAQAVALSPDSRMVLYGVDENVYLADASDGHLIRNMLRGGGSAGSLMLSPDKSHLLTFSEEGGARIWDVPSGNTVTLENAPNQGGIASFSKDGKSLLVAFGDQTIGLWDPATGRRLIDLGKVSQRPTSIVFHPDGNAAIVGCSDGSVHVMNFSNATETTVIELLPDNQATALRQNRLIVNPPVVFPAPDGALAAMWRSNFAEPEPEQPEIWEVVNTRKRCTFTGHTSRILSIRFSTDSQTATTASMDGTIRTWSTQDCHQIAAFDTGTYNSTTTLSDDGNLLVTGTIDGVQFFDNTGKNLGRYDIDGGVTTVALSSGSHFLFAAGFDGRTRVYDLRTGAEALQLMALRDGSWATADPAGHYDSSDPAHSEALYWVTTNLRTIDLGQLKNEYYTPRLLSRALSDQRLPTVTGMNQVGLAPVLTLQQAYDPVRHTMVVAVTNDGGGVGRMHLAVNGRLLQSIDVSVNPAAGQAQAYSLDLSNAPLVGGDNVIRVTAYDAGNRIESRPLETHYSLLTGRGNPVVTPDASQYPVGVGRFYAVVVGTSDFGDPAMHLSFPSHDATVMEQGLRLAANRLYGPDKVWMRVLTSGTDPTRLPTKANIKAAFDEVHRLARANDTLVVYFSGHGVMSSAAQDTYYYLTTDARTLNIDSDPTLRDVSTVSSAELNQWLREPARTMPLREVVILDTCAAGGAVLKLTQRRDVPPDQQRAMELLKDATGTFILMGSTSDAASYETSMYGEGLLTYALVEQMRGPALDDGSRLEVTRWFQKAIERVPDLANSVGGIQRPQVAEPGGVGFPIGLLEPADIAQIPLALPRPQLLRVICSDSNQDDPLTLRDTLRQQLRATNDPLYSGTSAAKKIVYIDSSDDDLPGAFSPRVLYSVSGATVTLRLRLVRNAQTVVEQDMTAAANDPDLASSIAQTLATMAWSIPK